MIALYIMLAVIGLVMVAIAVRLGIDLHAVWREEEDQS